MSKSTRLVKAAKKEAAAERLKSPETAFDNFKATALEKTAAYARKSNEAAKKVEAAYKFALDATEESAVIKAMETAEKESRKAQNALLAAESAAKEAGEATAANLYDMREIYKITAGVDVHKEKLAVAVLGGDGVEGHVESFESGTFKIQLEATALKLVKAGVQCVVMESTSVYWKEPYRKFTEAGLHVVVGNARHIKSVPGRKTDTADARWLANVARFGLVRPSMVLSQEMDELRDLARVRQSYVEEMTANKNKVVKLLVQGGFNISQVATDVFGMTGRMVIDGLLADKTPNAIYKEIAKGPGWRLKTTKAKLIDAIQGEMSEDLKIEIKSLMDVMATLDENIGMLESRLERRLIETGNGDSIRRLQTIPGMSKVGAMIVLAELGGGVSSFRSAEALSSWAGMCPGNNESAGKRKSGRTLFGNKRLKRILCEAAWAATKTKCYFKEKWDSLMPRLRFKKAIVAIGHKLLIVIYHMLSRQTIYRDPKVNLKEEMVKRNAPRWLKMMAEFLNEEAASEKA